MCMPPSRGPERQPRSRRWGVRGGDRRAGPHRGRVGQPPGRGGPAAAGAGQPGLDRAGQRDGGGHRRDHVRPGVPPAAGAGAVVVAQELVQDVQRERVAAKALDDARVRAAEARAREAEQALQAAQTGLARRTAALTETKMSWPRASEPLTSATTSPMSGTGPLMTATISPTLASGPPMNATGSPTNPSSGRVEGAAGTNELGSVRTVPRRQVLLCSGATRKWGHPTRHLPPLPAAVGPPATPPRVPRVGRWPGSRSRR